jgi:predicted alpha-1,2-mannosidase
MTSASLTDLVNPLQGTASGFHFSAGNTLPFVCQPHAMMGWTMQTAEDSGFLYDDRAPKLQGIRASNCPSPWMGDYAWLTMMPMTGALIANADGRASSFDRTTRVVKPHKLHVDLLRYQIAVDMSATERCALFRVTFPAGADGHIVFQPHFSKSSVRVNNRNRMIEGRATIPSAEHPEFALYYVIAFRSPWKKAGVILQEEFSSQPRVETERAGAWVTLDGRHRAVEFVVGLSFISHEQARINLQREIGDASLKQVENRTRQRWDDLLGRIEVEMDSEERLQTFYTSLYRALLFPRKAYELNSKGQPTHRSPYDGRVRPGVLYKDNGFWDTHRTVYSFLSVAYPDLLPEILEGWTQAAKEGGWFPRWSSPSYQACMTGTHSDAVIADAVVKGITDFDLEAAWPILRRHFLEPAPEHGKWGRAGLEAYLKHGYIPAEVMHHSVSATQEYAYCDYCLAQVARHFKADADYGQLMQRSTNYRNVFDSRTGFMRARRKDGSWVEPFREFEWGGPYIEGGPWQWSWTVPHDPEDLIRLHGGRAKTVRKLDRMLSTPPHFEVGTYGFEIHEMSEMAAVPFGQYAHSNQPVHHVLYLYTLAGAHDKAAHWIGRVCRELHSARPDGLAGDEDNGEMSCWYLFSALGFYPFCPGKPEYVLGAPEVRAARIHRPDGSSLKITTSRKASAAVMLDGKAHDSAVIPHTFVASGRTLTFRSR